MERYIETERLVLVPMTAEYAEDAFEWLSDPEVARFMPYNPYTSVDEVRKWIESLEENDNEYAFVLKGKAIGAGSVCYSEKKGTYVLGYNMNRAYWGKGYATEASKGMLKWAQEQLGATSFIADHAIDNPASGRVLEKCGFTFVGYGSYSKLDRSKQFEAKVYELRQ